MTGYGVGPSSVPWAITAWGDIEDLMEKARSELAGASSSGLPPTVQAAATSFLTAWTGYAAESKSLADGFVSALHSTNALYTERDTLTEEQLQNLDGRLGPAR